MNRWFAMLFACLALALGPGVHGIAAACQPGPAIDTSCGDECCCGDESACPCVHSTPDRSELPPATPRPANDTRPILISVPSPVLAWLVEIAPRPAAFFAPRDRVEPAVRSQALLCRWRT